MVSRYTFFLVAILIFSVSFTMTFLLLTTFNMVPKAGMNHGTSSCNNSENSNPRNPIGNENSEKTFGDYFLYSPCKNIHGKLAIFTVSSGTGYLKIVQNAKQSLFCYAKIKGYTLIQYEESAENKNFPDPTIPEKCPAKALMVKRHCIVAHLLKHFDYVIHLDADSGVINPNHCFEEYITPGIDLFFSERIHSGEIEAGHYIAKNTTFAMEFLLKWYRNAEKSGDTDNGVLIHELYSLLPDSNYKVCTDLKKTNALGYFQWQRCMKEHLNGKNTFDHIKIYKRAHGFARDGWTSEFKWSDYDFLIHAMKYGDDRFFKRSLNEFDCSRKGWFLPYKEELYVDMETMKEIWRDVETKSIVDKGFAVNLPNIGECWPNC